MIALSFTLAGLAFDLQPGEGVPSPALPPAFAPFLASGAGEPAGVYEVTSRELPPADPRGTLWSCDTWRLGREPAGGYAVEIGTADGRWLTAARVSDDFSRGTVRAVAGRRGEPSPYALNYPCDQAILMNRLLHFGAGIIHACGVVVDGQGVVFAGRSGAGKTTIARLWRAHGGALLNDDRVILRSRESGVAVASSPWHGEEREVRAGEAPLKAIFHLVQAPENRLRPLGEAEALARLAATAVAPFYLADGMERLLAAWSDIVRRVPSCILEFTPDPRALALCRPLLK